MNKDIRFYCILSKKKKKSQFQSLLFIFSWLFPIKGGATANQRPPPEPCRVRPPPSQPILDFHLHQLNLHSFPCSPHRCSGWSTPTLASPAASSPWRRRWGPGASSRARCPPSTSLSWEWAGTPLPTVPRRLPGVNRPRRLRRVRRTRTTTRMVWG